MEALTPPNLLVGGSVYNSPMCLMCDNLDGYEPGEFEWRSEQGNEFFRLSEKGKKLEWEKEKLSITRHKQWLIKQGK